MDKRNINDFSDDLINAFNFISITNTTDIIGSSINKKIHFISDYDLNEYISTDTKTETIYNDFKQIFINTKKDNNFFITDFKCGEKNNKPLRWNYDDIMKGSQKGITFNTALKQKDVVCKLDIIVLIDNKITEITNNYFFIKNENESKTNIMKSLMKSYKENIKEKNYMKALKRLYSYNKIRKPNNKQTELMKFFNSDVGRLNKIRSDLELIILLSEQPIDINIIKHNLQIIKYDISFSEFNISDEIDKICKLNNITKIIKKVNSIKNKLSKFINNIVKNEFF
jgi:hypothetical protein